MRKQILVGLAALTISTQVFASEGNQYNLHEYVKDGYSVGYTIDENCVLGQDFSMWSIGEGKLIKGWYIAYNIEEGFYYYITQDAAIEYLNNK